MTIRALRQTQRNKPMYDGVDLSGLRNIQSSAMTWDYLKRLRDITKMKVVIKGLLAWEDAKLAADNGYDAIIVSNHGARSEDSGRGTIDALAGNRRGRERPHPGPDRFRLPPRHRYLQGAVHGRDRVGIGRPISGASAPSANPASTRARTVAHRVVRDHAAGRRAFGQASDARDGAPRLRARECRRMTGSAVGAMCFAYYAPPAPALCKVSGHE